ncbi:peptidase C15 [Bosea sp. BK604]|uniref:pyroglutamyl-peptidase I family protein n=1 Tax=Bosea sp. BK604 TaxID=2512180 RepID=UPI0010DBC366|nr:peptidase C15 [Bosea sp. BK604]TCR64944.1 pyroglutamyl-peptidase [Bosea sp. BK604]
MKTNAGVDILVTGFGPFPHVRVNPTTELARQVARRLKAASFKAEALILETSYAGGLPALRKHLDEARPKAVLMLGLAGRARFVRVELFARGHSSRLHVDATGKVPAGNGSGALPSRTTANAEGALALLRRQGLRTRLSPSAGRYLCDASYAVSLAAAGREGVPVLFVHVPWLRPGPGRKPKARVAGFRPAVPALVTALAGIGAAMARAGR